MKSSGVHNEVETAKLVCSFGDHGLHGIGLSDVTFFNANAQLFRRGITGQFAVCGDIDATGQNVGATRSKAPGDGAPYAGGSGHDGDFSLHVGFWLLASGD
jgi:hypothetical protein